MMVNRETGEIHSDEKTALSQQTRRVAELIRLPGVASFWRQQCLASWQDEQQRRRRHSAWQQERAEYAAHHFRKEKSGKKPPRPGDEWSWGAERLFSSDGTKTWFVEGWFAPEFAAERAPFAGPILPFSSSYALTLADCYRVLAVVHDAERQGTGQIEPFSADAWDASCAYAAAMSHVHDMSESDHLTLDDCLARVETDLREERLPLEGSARAKTPQTENAPNRLLFDQDTWTITLDGVPMKIEKPKAFLIFKAIYECPHITRPNLRARISGAKGDKTIPNMIQSLPSKLRTTIKSNNAGYWVALPPKKKSANSRK